MSRVDWAPTPGAVAFGGATVLLGAALLARLLRPSIEARHYARDILGGTEGAGGKLEALALLEETRERAMALRQAVEQAPVGA